MLNYCVMTKMDSSFKLSTSECNFWCSVKIELMSWIISGVIQYKRQNQPELLAKYQQTIDRLAFLKQLKSRMGRVNNM